MTGVDAGMIAAFVDEADEALAEAERALLALLADGESRGPIEAAFRALHSLKGDAALLGLSDLKMLAHACEDVLAALRNGVRRADGALVELLLQGCRALARLVAATRAGRPDAIAERTLEELLPRLERARLEESLDDEWPAALAELAELRSLVDGALESRLAALESRLRRLAPGAAEGGEDTRPAAECLQSLLREPVAGQLDGAAAARIQQAIIRFAREADTPAVADCAQRMSETYEAFVEAMGFTETLRGLLLEQLATLPAAAPASAALAAAPTLGAGASGIQAVTQGGKTMRVSERHVDGFLGHVGELIVVGHMFRHLQTRIESRLRDQVLVHQLRQANETFQTLSTALQRSIMSVRKVPMRGLLGKVPRIVHEVCQATGKRIRARCTGEDIEVDKSLLELLDAPLVHLVRNAGDHGIEAGERRLAAGKSAEGTVSVSAAIVGGQLRLEVADDGGGIDGERVLAAATRQGVHLPPLEGNALLLELIMRPGLSTAAAVTDISGRGVGMDVVRHRIREAGGSIVLHNRPGHGATFTITLPTAVTTQIISGLLVEGGEGIHVLPADRVRETLALAGRPLTRPPRGLPLIAHGGRNLPLIGLGDLLGRPDEAPQVGVLVDAHAGLVVIGVRAVIGLQTLVLRHIDGLAQDGLIQGGALLGDGSVALVLDPDRIHTIGTDPESL